MIKITDEILMSYADGELEENIAKQVEQALANDTSLRDKVTKHHALRTEFNLAFDGINEAPIPDSIKELLQEDDTNVVSLSDRIEGKHEQKKKQWWQPTAIAASIALAFLVGMFSSEPITDKSLLTVNNQIAYLLETKSSGSSEMDIVFQGSFIKADGSFCRTFQEISSDIPTNALSCRNLSGDWKIISLVPGVPTDAYLPASGDVESIIEQLTNSMQLLSVDEEKKYLK